MPTCPVCSAPVSTMRDATPYWTCGQCDAWFQDPLPPKTYEGTHEKTADGGFAGHLMSDHDKGVNDQLAEWVFRTFLRGVPRKALDVGSKYPYLSHCLRKRGCDAYGMDNIEIVPEYSRELGVPMLLMDFEHVSARAILDRTNNPGDRFGLVTLIHCFEHIYRPHDALAKLRELVADDGFVLLRLPDHAVSGFEHDLAPSYFAIHPYFHSLTSILELLVIAQDKFELVFTSPLEGAGQRDIVLRPLARKPKVMATMIVKNEERDLPRALASIAPVVDGAVIADTGSTDGTARVIEEMRRGPYRDKVLEYFPYLDASERDESGDWKLWDFGKARNASVARIAETDADWVLWFDADDELLTPRNLLRAIYLGGQYSVFGVRIRSSGDQWVHHRLWRNKLGIVFDGACHEYPTILSYPCLDLLDSFIEHHAAPGAGENSNARNLRILKRAYETHPTPRTAFYLANTYKDSGRYAEAIEPYAARIAFGPGYRDEWLFAYLYKARMERASGRIEEAKGTLFEAIARARDWSEFWMELAYIFYDEKNYEACVGTALMAHNNKPPPTALWREFNKYTDQPLRLISWCHEHQGDVAQALDRAREAKALIAPDPEWDERIRRLESMLGAAGGVHVRVPGPAGASAGAAGQVRRIALHRPGAIGDILMTLNLIPLLRSQHPGASIAYYCHLEFGGALAGLLAEAGVDEVADAATFAGRAATYDLCVNLVGYPLAEGYPERPMRRHLLEYFADEMGVRLARDAASGTVILPSLVARRPERLPGLPPGHYATLQAKAGWSVYKEWPIERWAALLAQNPDLPVYQIGTQDDPRVPGARHDFMGTPLTTALALFANASLHLGVDSFANHLTQYVWQPVRDGRPAGPRSKVPGIILWGSTQASAAGYPGNANLVSPEVLACQPCFREDPRISRMPRGLCINPPGQTSYDDPRHRCMQNITVDMVAQRVRAMWPRLAGGPEPCANG